MPNTPPTKIPVPTPAPKLATPLTKAESTLLATPPTIPLTDDNRKAYQDLYDKLQAEIESTHDEIARNTLENPRDEVDEILDMNDTYALNKDTELLTELLGQIKDTNKSLVTLQAEINAVASHISTAATIIAAIDKVITLVPAF